MTAHATYNGCAAKMGQNFRLCNFYGRNWGNVEVLRNFVIETKEEQDGKYKTS